MFLFQIFYILHIINSLKTEILQSNVCNGGACRKLDLPVGKIPHFNHQSTSVILIDVSTRFKGQGQTLVGKQKHGQSFAGFPLDDTRSVNHLYFSRVYQNITLAKQPYSVFYERQKMIWYWFREELLQIVILFPIGNHIFRHVATLVSACKLRLSKKTFLLIPFALHLVARSFHLVIESHHPTNLLVSPIFSLVNSI